MADTAQFIPPSTSSTTTTATPSELSPELAQTLALLSTHRSVLGYILLAHVHHGTGVSIIRHSGVVFDGEGGRTYAGVIARIVDSVRQGMDEVGEEVRCSPFVR